MLAIGGLIAAVSALAAFAPGALRAVWGAFTSIGSKMYGAGRNFMFQLADGVLGGLPTAVAAAWKAAKLIGDHFIGHSPPPLGPLSQLANNGLMATLGASLKPDALLASVKRMARVLAVSVPMVVAPAAAIAGGVGAGLGSAGASVVNHIAYSPVVNIKAGAGADRNELKLAVMEALNQHIDELDRRLTNHRRTQDRARF